MAATFMSKERRSDNGKLALTEHHRSETYKVILRQDFPYEDFIGPMDVGRSVFVGGFNLARIGLFAVTFSRTEANTNSSYVLRLAFRIDAYSIQKTIVANNRANGVDGQEIRKSFTRKMKTPFCIEIRAAKKGFKVIYDGAPLLDFPYRSSSGNVLDYAFLSIDGVAASFLLSEVSYTKSKYEASIDFREYQFNKNNMY